MNQLAAVPAILVIAATQALVAPGVARSEGEPATALTIVGDTETNKSLGFL